MSSGTLMRSICKASGTSVIDSHFDDSEYQKYASADFKAADSLNSILLRAYWIWEHNAAIPKMLPKHEQPVNQP